MMPILFHYQASPFAELVRLAMGLKGLEWRSVIVPNVMPKPDQIELTGGYGRTPVLQIGADIYCDTSAILMALEHLQPEPSLYPAPLGMLHRVLANWAGGPQFLAHVGAAMGTLPPGALSDEFHTDRKARFGFDMGALAAAEPHLKTQAMAAAHLLGATLGDGRAFVGGAAPGHADLAFYSNIWLIESVPTSRATLAEIMATPALADWYARVAAIGHAVHRDITGEEAVAVAAAAVPVVSGGVVGAGFAPGQAVKVRTEGSFDLPVAGTLARLDPIGITVLRRGERCGEVAVHFPRLGQMVLP